MESLTEIKKRAADLADEVGCSHGVNHGSSSNWLRIKRTMKLGKLKKVRQITTAGEV